MSAPSHTTITERVASVSGHIRSTAKRYSSAFLVDAEDLEQEGTMKALHLASIYKDGLGASFWSYAWKGIRDRMLSAAINAAKVVSCTLDEQFLSRRVSLNLTFPGEDENLLSRTLPSNDPCVYDLMHEAETTEAIATALQILPERERTIINARFFEGRTLAEVGTALAMSGENVRKLERSALQKLRRHPHLQRLAA